MHGTAWLLLPAALAFGVIAWLRRMPIAARLADRPNHRSLHVTPTPRVGGLGILAGALPCIVFFADEKVAAIAAAAAFVALVSLLDDLHGLPIQVRLPAHLVAAAVVVLMLAGPYGGFSALAALAAVLAIAWAANLFNFMDGSDGLAGGMAVIGFAAYAFAAQDAGVASLAWAGAALSAAAAGFLAHNFPPARVFMGDAGSVPLGFLAAALGLYGVSLAAWPAWFPLLVFAPFVLDASVTLLRRLARRERVWVAHREHFYQRLVLSGWSARRVAIGAYALMITSATGALCALREGHSLPYVIIALLAAMHGLVFLVIERRFRAAARR